MFARIALVAAALLVVAVSSASADLGPEQPASLVIFPLVLADAAIGQDTTVQLNNASDAALDVRCFYENANSHCVDTGNVCTSAADCDAGEICEPGFSASSFDLRLTARQPIGWQASRGLDSLPLPSNQGSIPPLPESPFRGSLRCISTDASGTPIAANFLFGSATIERFDGEEDSLDIAKYGALGASVVDTLVDDGRLLLGGFPTEYEGCANTVIFQSPYSPGFDPSGILEIESTLVLLPCSVSYGAGRPGRAEVTYEVINEFGERRRRDVPLTVEGLLMAPLEEIDPLLFSQDAQGTAAGQTRLTSTGSGIVGLLIQSFRAADGDSSSRATIRGLRYQGERADADVISLDAGETRCGGDCNGDGRVDVAELVNSVAIALGRLDVASCPAADIDDSGTITVAELITAVGNLLDGCP